MILQVFKDFSLDKALLLFLLVSSVILVLFPKEGQAETGLELGDNDEGFWESQDIPGAQPQAQNEDSYMEILEKLRSYEQFMTKLNGAVEKLDELYAFFPLLQQLKKERQEQERLKSEMMKSPRAKLYTGKNLTGNFEIYDFNSAYHGKGCHWLQSYAQNIKSIDTEGTCVRLFSECPCAYWSQAFYPGMDGNSIDSKLEGVRCVGPCSPNELEDVEIEGVGSKLAVKKGENGVPDLIGDYHTWENQTYPSSSLTNIVGYTLGVGNRLEGVFARIYLKHLRTPQEAEQVRNAGRNFTDARFQLDEDREQVGFAIPLELGGVSNQLYNIFPQNKARTDKYRQTLVSPIKQYLQNNPSKYAWLYLRFFYETPRGTKPRGIWYWSECGDNGPVSGYLFN